jgi:membrane protein required for colicin V production
MWIDLVWLALIVMAVFKGFSRGLIGAVFSFAALFIGLAAALKLSAIVAVYLNDSFEDHHAWWPVVAFILVFLFVSGLIKMAAAIVEKTLDFVMLGWVNKIGGFLVYAVLYTLVYSVVLFYIDQISHISAHVKQQSMVYDYIEPWGEWVMNALGNIIPWFRDVFKDMQDFFGKVGGDIQKS